MGVKSCIVCEVSSGKVQPPGGLLYKDSLWTVHHAAAADAEGPILLKGLLLVAPLRHVEQLHELTDEEARYLVPLLHDVTLALWRCAKPKKIHVCSFDENIRHMHFYAIPRYDTMPTADLEMLGGIFRQKKYACPRKEAVALALKLKAELEMLVESRKKSSDYLDM